MEEPTLSRTTTNCLPPSAVVHLFHKHTAHKNICICLFGINMATAIPRKNVSSSLHAPYLSFWLLSLDPRWLFWGHFIAIQLLFKVMIQLRYMMNIIYRMFYLAEAKPSLSTMAISSFVQWSILKGKSSHHRLNGKENEPLHWISCKTFPVLSLLEDF